MFIDVLGQRVHTGETRVSASLLVAALLDAYEVERCVLAGDSRRAGGDADRVLPRPRPDRSAGGRGGTDSRRAGVGHVPTLTRPDAVAEIIERQAAGR